jgi:hypothetical protein
MYLAGFTGILRALGAVVHAGDIEVFSVDYGSGSVGRQVLHDVNCDACRTYLTSKVLLPVSVFIYFKEYCDTEQSLTYPSDLLLKERRNC